MRLRWVVFLAGLAASVALTVALWTLGFPGFFLFLLFPFLWFPFGRRQAPPVRCPACGWSTRDPAAAYCPRDRTRLVDKPEGPAEAVRGP